MARGDGRQWIIRFKAGEEMITIRRSGSSAEEVAQEFTDDLTDAGEWMNLVTGTGITRIRTGFVSAVEVYS